MGKAQALAHEFLPAAGQVPVVAHPAGIDHRPAFDPRAIGQRDRAGARCQHARARQHASGGSAARTTASKRAEVIV
jgi:hypothetical protein